MSNTWQTTLAELPAPLQREADVAWENMMAACDSSQRERYAALVNSADFSRQLAIVFACSPFAAQLCRRFPDWLLTLHAGGDLQRSLSNDDWTGRLHTQLETPLALDVLDSGLRRFRNREFLRVIWRDFNRLAPMRETTADVSAIAEHCIQVTLDFHYAQLCSEWGTPIGADNQSPQPLVVLGMGKLGACELNLSSDIDLIFAYPSSGETSDGPITVSNQEFFVRLGQRLIKSLDQTTADG